MCKDVLTFYSGKSDALSLRLSKMKRLMQVLSLLRLSVFILFAVILYFALMKGSVLLVTVMFVVFLLSFISLIVMYEKLKKKRLYHSNLKGICDGEIKSINEDYSSFAEGKEYINPKHYYSYDLDLFGRNSVFQSVNRTVTIGGKEALAEMFLRFSRDKEHIRRRQAGVREMAGFPETFLHYRAKGMTADDVKDDKKDIEDWLGSEDIVSSSAHRRLGMYAIPAVNVLLIGICCVGFLSFSIVIVAAIVLFMLSGYNMKKINRRHNQLSKKDKILRKYCKLIEVIEGFEGESEYVGEIKGAVMMKGGKASREIKRLSGLINALDNRLNFLVGSLLNIFFLYDFHILFRMERWKDRNSENVLRWLDATARFDALCSMGAYAFANKDYIFPEISDSEVLRADNMGHPMIPRAVRVNNSITIEKTGKIDIVTGPNMAGKSTFLRTVGVNLVLAQAGLPICADAFTFTPMKLFTSMRTTDSLDKNESYFHAELKRLAVLINRLKEGEECFVILDELLKGTNSTDKLNGSREFIKHILKYRCCGLIATHDLPLTEMVRDYPDNIGNKCFEVTISGQNIEFDYKLKDGVTRNMNASILMKRMNIIE